MDFDYATVQSGVSGIFRLQRGRGQRHCRHASRPPGPRRHVLVIERKALDKILTEQNFSNSNRADPSSAAKIGKLLGVSVIVVGSITQFGRDDKKDFGGRGRWAASQDGSERAASARPNPRRW